MISADPVVSEACATNGHLLALVGEIELADPKALQAWKRLFETKPTTDIHQLITIDMTEDASGKGNVDAFRDHSLKVSATSFAAPRLQETRMNPSSPTTILDALLWIEGVRFEQGGCAGDFKHRGAGKPRHESHITGFRRLSLAVTCGSQRATAVYVDDGDGTVGQIIGCHHLLELRLKDRIDAFHWMRAFRLVGPVLRRHLLLRFCRQAQAGLEPFPCRTPETISVGKGCGEKSDEGEKAHDVSSDWGCLGVPAPPLWVQVGASAKKRLEIF